MQDAGFFPKKTSHIDWFLENSEIKICPFFEEPTQPLQGYISRNIQAIVYLIFGAGNETRPSF